MEQVDKQYIPEDPELFTMFQGLIHIVLVLILFLAYFQCLGVFPVSYLLLLLSLYPIICAISMFYTSPSFCLGYLQDGKFVDWIEFLASNQNGSLYNIEVIKNIIGNTVPKRDVSRIDSSAIVPSCAAENLSHSTTLACQAIKPLSRNVSQFDPLILGTHLIVVYQDEREILYTCYDYKEIRFVLDSPLELRCPLVSEKPAALHYYQDKHVIFSYSDRFQVGTNNSCMCMSDKVFRFRAFASKMAILLKAFCKSPGSYLPVEKCAVKIKQPFLNQSHLKKGTEIFLCCLFRLTYNITSMPLFCKFCCAFWSLVGIVDASSSSSDSTLSFTLSTIIISMLMVASCILLVIKGLLYVYHAGLQLKPEQQIESGIVSISAETIAIPSDRPTSSVHRSSEAESPETDNCESVQLDITHQEVFDISSSNLVVGNLSPPACPTNQNATKRTEIDARQILNQSSVVTNGADGSESETIRPAKGCQVSSALHPRELPHDGRELYASNEGTLARHRLEKESSSHKHQRKKREYDFIRSTESDNDYVPSDFDEVLFIEPIQVLQSRWFAHDQSIIEHNPPMVPHQEELVSVNVVEIDIGIPIENESIKTFSTLLELEMKLFPLMIEKSG